MNGYQTHHQHIAVRGAADLLIRSLRDRQQYADDPPGEAQRRGISSATWPLFGLPWPSGHELAAALAAHPVTAGERILELGCGLALASLVAHRRGADVTASDCHPLAGRFLRENLRLNTLPPLPYRHGQWGEARRDPAATAPSGEPALQGGFGLLIGSDLLYERDERGTLAGFIDAHALPRSEVWIVDPNRGNRAAFHRAMADHGFMLCERPLATAATPGRPAYRGRLLRYRRGTATAAA